MAETATKVEERAGSTAGNADAPAPQPADPAPPSTPRMPMGLLLAMMLAAAWMLKPYWSWLVLAVWVGSFGRKQVPSLTRLTGRRARAAAILTAALLTVLVVPVGLVLWALVGDAIVKRPGEQSVLCAHQRTRGAVAVGDL